MLEYRIAGEDPRLGNGLIGTAVDQLGRAVGAEHQQRNPRQSGFDDSGIEVSYRRARGGDDGYRLVQALGQAQREEAESALIKVQVTAHTVMLGRSQGQGG